MASSRPDPADDTPAAFALQELHACWSQAYEAMTRGDLAVVAGLLDAADEQLELAGDGTDDTPEEAAHRNRAMSTYSMLQHAMHAGLDGLKDEIAHSRRGKKALRGYDHAADNVGGRVERSV